MSNVKSVSKYKSSGPMVALCIHDLRVSGGTDTREKICGIQEKFQQPVTVHLVLDVPLEARNPLETFLAEEIGAGRLELVFHGTRHTCPLEIGRALSFYHKHQAEYLNDAPELREQTLRTWQAATRLFGPLGICPPCWIASRQNWRFLSSLSPLYLESTWRLRSQGRTVPVSIVSLGSPDPKELVGLRLLGRALLCLGHAPGLGRWRVAIHACDLERPDSMDFFHRMVSSLKAGGAKPVLQRQLLT